MSIVSFFKSKIQHHRERKNAEGTIGTVSNYVPGYQHVKVSADDKPEFGGYKPPSKWDNFYKNEEQKRSHTNPHVPNHLLPEYNARQQQRHAEHEVKMEMYRMSRQTR